MIWGNKGVYDMDVDCQSQLALMPENYARYILFTSRDVKSASYNTRSLKKPTAQFVFLCICEPLLNG